MKVVRYILIALWVLLFVFDAITGDYFGAIGDLAWAAALVVLTSNYALCVILEVVACLLLGISCYLIGSAAYIVYMGLIVVIIILALVQR